MVSFNSSMAELPSKSMFTEITSRGAVRVDIPCCLFISEAKLALRRLRPPFVKVATHLTISVQNMDSNPSLMASELRLPRK
jgi:hypothetical protein